VKDFVNGNGKIFLSLEVTIMTMVTPIFILNLQQQDSVVIDLVDHEVRDKLVMTDETYRMHASML
jgi:hypothetical protein